MSSAAETIRRVAIFTGSWSFGTRRHVGRLADSFPDIEFRVFIHTPRRDLRRIGASQIRNLRRHGWRWIPYRLGRAVDRVQESLAPRQSDPAAPGARYSEAALRSRRNVTADFITDINAPPVGEAVREWGADLGIAVSAPLLRATTFDAPRLGSINIHRGRIPEYRGMPVAFWELHDGADAVGCTIHRVVDRLDAGDILLEELVPVPPHATVRGMQIVLEDVGLRLIVQAVERIRTGRARWRTPQITGRPRTRPPLALERAVHRRLQREGSGRRTIRTTLKPIGLAAYNTLIGTPARIARGLTGRQRIIVLLYHRVRDDMRDDLTTGIEQFERHVNWLRRNCHVVRVEDVIAGRVNRRSLRPLVAITFDDGYADNAEHAAPILERHGLPATFFIATGIVGTDRPFPHDVRRGVATIPAMRWEQARELQAAGFSVGCHTHTHIDCGSASGEEIRAELSLSLAALRRELGLEHVSFAFPYGRPENITPAALAIVRELQLTACLSAYGGANARVEPFNVLRKGVHHDFSLAALKARVHGLG